MSETDIVARKIKECVAEGDGFWRTCSGCHESEDGHDIGHYPHSKTFGCKLGGGCGDCGGIGAVWDTTDYEDMAASINAEDAEIVRLRSDLSRMREALETARSQVSELSATGRVAHILIGIDAALSPAQKGEA